MNWVQVSKINPPVNLVVFALTDLGHPAIVFMNEDGSFTDERDGDTANGIEWWMRIEQPERT